MKEKTTREKRAREENSFWSFTIYAWSSFCVSGILSNPPSYILYLEVESEKRE